MLALQARDVELHDDHERLVSRALSRCRRRSTSPSCATASASRRAGERGRLGARAAAQWTAADEQRGPVAMVEVCASSAEYAEAVVAFRAGLSKYGTTHVEVLKLERVQNVAMWQAFAVKHAEFQARERDRELDNLTSTPPDELERKWLFHGTDAWTLGKICRTGFNRSFAGRNMCK